MNFVKSLDFLGIPAKEIPCIKGKGEPTEATGGAVGVLYLDTDGEEIFVCTAVSGAVFIWEPLTKKLQERVDALADEVAELNPFKFKSISSSPSVCELGQTVDTVTVSWSLNKEAVSQTFQGEPIDATLREKTLTGLSLTKKYTVTVTATDKRGDTITGTATVNFYNGVYYGVLTKGAALNSAAILGMTRKLQGSRALTFTVTAGASQQIAYALPASGYGTPAFNVGGFDGGFYLAGTVSFKNASGHTESYNVWLSDEAGLGATTVKVT